MLERRSIKEMIHYREGQLERLYVREEVYQTQTFIEKSLEPILTNLFYVYLVTLIILHTGTQMV